ncbi:MAG: hypothetical protein WCS70_14050 [Verrucomicrobiota bacterium]
MSPDLVLTPGEKLAPAWQKVMRIITMRLDTRRSALEGVKSPDETNVLRGEIKALRGLLRLNDDDPSVIE